MINPKSLDAHSGRPIAHSAVSADGGWVEILRGGDRIFIRPIRRDDVEMERRFIEELSPVSRRFRFLESITTPSEALLRQLTNTNPLTDAAYVAVVDDARRDHEVAVARFSARPDDKDCEFALVVNDQWQGKGLGTHLMWHLVEAARCMGITTMHSSDASSNDLMRRFAKHLHLNHKPDPKDATQVLYTVDLARI